VPAHLLLLEGDKHGLTPFFSSETLGLNKLKESTAFKKIAVTKKANSLALSPSLTKVVSETQNIDNLYMSDELFQKARNYGLKRQQNLLSAKNVNLIKETFLETRTSLPNFPPYSPVGTSSKDGLQLSLQDTTRVTPYTQATRLDNSTLRTASSYLSYENPTQAFFNAPAPASSGLLPTTSTTAGFAPSAKAQLHLQSESHPTQTPLLASDNQSYLPSEQSPKQMVTLNSLRGVEQVTAKVTKQPFSQSALHLTHSRAQRYAATLARQTTNKVLFDLPASPVSSNNPLVEALNYDTTNALQVKNLRQTKTSFRQTSQVLGESVAILQGKRDGAPQFLQSTY